MQEGERITGKLGPHRRLEAASGNMAYCKHQVMNALISVLLCSISVVLPQPQDSTDYISFCRDLKIVNIIRSFSQDFLRNLCPD